MNRPPRWFQAHKAPSRAAENVQSLVFVILFMAILFAVTLAPQ